MNDDQLAYNTWKSVVDSLKPEEGKAIPAIVHYAKLEEAIESYGVR